MEKIESALDTLKDMYTSLTKANVEFVEALEGAAAADDADDLDETLDDGLEEDTSFQDLVARRGMIVDDSEHLIRELKQIIHSNHEEVDLEKESFVKVLFKILEFYPTQITRVEALNATLGELVESDRLVAAQVEALRAAVKTELGRVRQNSKSLKGYNQLDSYGSCFINKFK